MQVEISWPKPSVRSNSRAMTCERIARIFENFQRLDSMRKNIGEIFTSIRSTLNRIG
jgi:hypothetical protein